MSDYDRLNLVTSNIGDIMRQQRQHMIDEQERQAKNSGRYDAADIFQHLMRRVKEFQSNLSEKEEIGLQLANFGLAAQVHIRSIGYRNPNIIEFHGVNADDHEVTLIQHISQLNFMLIAVKPIEEKPYRIGFR